jgi:hypothetical protein
MNNEVPSIIHDDCNQLVISTNPITQIVPISVARVNVDGAFYVSGLGGYNGVKDRTTSDEFGNIAQGGVYQLLVNGTGRWFLDNNGLMALGVDPAITARYRGIFNLWHDRSFTMDQGVKGLGFNLDSNTYTQTNNNTTSGLNNFYIAPMRLQGTGATTFNGPSSLYIGGAPYAGTSATVNSPWSLNVDAGNVRLGVVDSTASPTGGVLYRDFATGQVKMTAFPSGGSSIYTTDGVLTSDRLVGSGGYTLRFHGTNNSDTIMSIINNGTASTGLYSFGSLYAGKFVSNTVGVHSFGTTNGASLTGDTDEGLIAKSNTIRGATIQSVPSSTNTTIEVLRIERGSTGGPGGNGIGGSADFYNKNSDNTSNLSNQLISKWTNATVGSRTSQFSITGVNGASTGTILTIDGDGTFTTAGKHKTAPITSSAGTLTIGNAESYFFNGTTTTWTLPAVSGTAGTIYYLCNIGSGNITVNANAGANEIYDAAAVNTYSIVPAATRIFISNGTYWKVN